MFSPIFRSCRFSKNRLRLNPFEMDCVLFVEDKLPFRSSFIWLKQITSQTFFEVEPFQKRFRASFQQSIFSTSYVPSSNARTFSAASHLFFFQSFFLALVTFVIQAGEFCYYFCNSFFFFQIWFIRFNHISKYKFKTAKIR